MAVVENLKTLTVVLLLLLLPLTSTMVAAQSSHTEDALMKYDLPRYLFPRNAVHGYYFEGDGSFILGFKSPPCITTAPARPVGPVRFRYHDRLRGRISGGKIDNITSGVDVVNPLSTPVTRIESNKNAGTIEYRTRAGTVLSVPLAYYNISAPCNGGANPW